jgi:hypothetical protein
MTSTASTFDISPMLADPRHPSWNNLPSWVTSYIAGFIDGEGSISVCVAQRKDRPNPTFLLRFTACNTNKEVIDFIHSALGAGSVRCDNSASRRKIGRPVWVWSSAQKEGMEILKALEPYLIVKKRQANLVMELWSGISRGGPRTPIPKHEINRRARIVREIRLLNQGKDLPFGGRDGR